MAGFAPLVMTISFSALRCDEGPDYLTGIVGIVFLRSTVRRQPIDGWGKAGGVVALLFHDLERVRAG